MKIKNQVAIVTGASSGIGMATAKLLTKLGAKVALVARSEDILKKLAKELPDSLPITADMTKVNEIKNFIKKIKKHYGRIDILVNNAGQGYDASIENIDLKSFRKIFDLDVVGPLIAMQQVIPIMKKQGKGMIVNISSGTALMSLPNMAGYSSLKRALVGISLTAREEFKKDHIGVSVVYPFITATDFEKNTIKASGISSFEEPQENGGDFKIPDADSADYVAEKIIEAITSEKAEIFAHDWMNRQTK